MPWDNTSNSHQFLCNRSAKFIAVIQKAELLFWVYIKYCTAPKQKCVFLNCIVNGTLPVWLEYYKYRWMNLVHELVVLQNCVCISVLSYQKNYCKFTVQNLRKCRVELVRLKYVAFLFYFFFFYFTKSLKVLEWRQYIRKGEKSRRLQSKLCRVSCPTSSPFFLQLKSSPV